MLGLMGLLGALIAGLVADSVMVSDNKGNGDDDAAAPSADEQPPETGDLVDDLDTDVVGDGPAAQGPMPPTPEPAAELLPDADEPDPIPGTTADDVLTGTAGDDWIDAGDGDDGLMGGAGADTLHGGAGDDALVGNDDTDADMLFGDTGDDALSLGHGDTGTGGAGQDSFTLADFGPGLAPSVITDYTPADDRIVLLYDADVHPDPWVMTQAIEGTDDVSVLLDGIEIAIVQGAAGLMESDIQLLAA